MKNMLLSGLLILALGFTTAIKADIGGDGLSWYVNLSAINTDISGDGSWSTK